MQSLAGTLVCGTSVLKHKPTKQSSTASGSGTCGLGSNVTGAYSASRAVDGKCQGKWTGPKNGSCSMTAKQDYPWWQVSMATAVGTRPAARREHNGAAGCMFGRVCLGAACVHPALLCSAAPAARC